MSTKSETFTVRFPAAEARRLSDIAKREGKTYSEVIRAALHARTPAGIAERLANEPDPAAGISVADIWTILGLQRDRWRTIQIGEAVAFEQSVLYGDAVRVVTLRLEDVAYRIPGAPEGEGT